jgi:protein-disulfide isomerase
MSRNGLGIWVGSIFALWLGACSPPAARSADGQIDLSQPEAEHNAAEEPPPPKLRQQTCAKDGTGCQRKADAASNAPELDEAKTYDVRVDALDPRRGPAQARVTAIVFSDFQCPFCRHLELTLAELGVRHPNELQVVWKDMPLEAHVHAGPAALLAREAQARGGDTLFWQVHGAIYDQQQVLGDASLAQVAARFGLHWPPLPKFQPLIDKSYAQGIELNLQATPTTFINGRPVVGVRPIEFFEERIKEELSRSAPTTVGVPASAL